MSLVNAVHELIEVAAGRRNLSGVAADELHAAIDAEQAPASPDPTLSSSADLAAPSAESSAGPSASEGAPWQS